jgi:hypothetical protein
MAKPTVYIETTIVSYLTAWPSRDIIRLADQTITREWWETQRGRFDLFTSELVVVEASAGDESAAKDRLAVLNTLRMVSITEEAEKLAKGLIAAAALPSNAARDALHVGIAAANGLEYLLTWNCTHLANGLLQSKIVESCEAHGFRAPLILTPSQLFDEDYHERRAGSD